MFKRINLLLSLFCFVLLTYNLFTAQFIASATSLVIFLFTCPYFFKKTKRAYPIIDKIAIIIVAIPLVYLTASISIGITTSSGDEIPAAEQLYIDTVLSQITSETTKEEAIELLGKPSRDLGLKLNWWVSIDNKDSRVGVYFSATTGKAEEIVLDGGSGRFYYRKNLIE